MSSGITDQLRQFSRTMGYRKIEPRETVERDRSLAGKARIRARRAARRAGASDE